MVGAEMAEAKRWSVTYTKHVTQKRKVYQDGHLQLSHNKIMLCDDSEKVIDSRFLKKDDTLKPGETLAFDSYLVDIGDAEGHADCKPVVVKLESECQIKENTVAEKHRFSHGKTLRNNPFSSDKKLGREKVSAINVSPSQKIIREWVVLYTGQMTQKAKKYHDGFLKLVICGSTGRQVKLYDENRNLLDSRFLKNDELIRSGDSLRFDAHLVDIGDADQDHEKVQDVKVEKQSCELSRKNRTFKWPTLQHNSSAGQQLGGAHLVRNVVSKSCKLGANQISRRKEASTRPPLRDANTILSNLKKPSARECVETMEGVPVKPPSPDMICVDSEVQDQLQVQIEYHKDNPVYISDLEQHSSNKRAAATIVSSEAPLSDLSKSIRREPTWCPGKTAFADLMSRSDSEVTASDGGKAAEMEGLKGRKIPMELNDFPSFDLGI